MQPSPRFVLLLFLIAQLVDGVLTYTAVAVLGAAAEGNMLLDAAMETAGAGPALFGAKMMAAAGGLLLYVRGCHRTLGALTALYMAAAITPWLYVFHNF